MEILHEDRSPSEGPAARRADLPAGKIYLGAVLALAGVVWLASNLHWIGFGTFRAIFSWRMLLVVIGGYLLALRQWSAGAIIGCVGIFFVVTDWLGVVFPFGKIVLPIAVIAVGIALMLSQSRKRP